MIENLTYEKLRLANESIKTTDIKGKEYAEVNQRIKAFRMVFPDGTIDTEMISNENGVCVFKCSVYNGNELLGTGHAYEKENSSFINKTSYIENCETSAVGRALGMCGFGIDTSVASYEEVQNAINNQENQTKSTEKDDTDYRSLVLAKVKELNLNTLDFAKQYGLNSKSTQEDFKRVYKELNRG